MKAATSPKASKPRPTPSEIERYTLLDKLGEGGMGIVWRARDTKTGSEVAIKIMKDISDAESLELFTKEWKTLSDLSHPNIVDVRDADVLHEDSEHKPFFVMPLLRGVTLASLIRNSSERLTCARVIEIFNQVCRGLQAAHQRGLIHRDLKPSNVFVMDDDTVKIIDFGVVHLAGTHSVPGQKGTYEYMSPEQIQAGELSPATDIFAVGVSMYEALTGRKPFTGRSLEETLQAVLKHIPPPVSEMNPAIPHTVSQVVHKCIAKQPINRFSSARELSESLAKAARNEPIFDVNRISHRLERIRSAIKSDDLAFASELLLEIQSEGHIHPEITHVGMQIEVAKKQKRIEHLLSGARARIEQGEIPLGLEKLRELLELAPDHSDALTLKALAENQRSEAQAGKWIELANTHLSNCDFVAARHAAREALNSRASDPRALQLLRRIESVEVEAKRVREQKEQLYLTALRHYQNGEIDSAFSRLGRLFSVARSRPEGAIPERDAIYESFYKEVCSEHDLIHAKLDEAQRHLADENFSQALAICCEQLLKHANNGAFQALKIQVEDAERQKISADLAIASKNADAEPDLDRRANIWREASQRHPSDTQFAQQLKVTCERRDLVNSIVAKAHQFSDKGLYNEELTQWEMLRNIHPRFPGLAFELEQCRRKRDLQARNEEKAQLVEEIVNLMEAQEFARALDKASSGLADFPNDAELAGLEKLSREGLERAQECSRLFATAQEEAAANHRDKAVDLLKQALQLEPRNSAVLDILINLLVERARSLLDDDLSAAESLYQQARSLNAGHRTVRSFDLEISDAIRQRYVGEYLTQARGLVAVGKPDEAWERVQEALKKYPREARLQQFRDFLIKGHPEFQLKPTRAEAEEAPSNHLRDSIQDPAGESPRNEADSADPVHEADQEALTSLLRGQTSATKDEAWPNQPGPSLADGGHATVVCNVGRNQKLKSRISMIHASARSWSRRLQLMYQATRGRRVLLASSGAGVLLAAGLGLAAYKLFRASVRTEPARIHEAVVHLTPDPADSVFKVAGIFHPGYAFNVPENRDLVVEVLHPGYQGKTVRLSAAEKNSAVSLDPLPVRITVVTAEKNGEVELDGSAAGTLVDGAIDGISVPADGKQHTLELRVDRHRVAAVEFLARPAQRPTLVSSNNSRALKNMFVVASMGPMATVYGGDQLKGASLSGSPFPFSRSGVDVNVATGSQTTITYDYGGQSHALNLEGSDWPSLSIRSFGLASELLITTNIEAAKLTANGTPVGRGARGWRMIEPGTYNFVLAADNYKTQTWTTSLKSGQNLREFHQLDVNPPVPAVLSALVVSGGTAGAAVDVDGSSAGTLDENGAAHFATKLTAGPHAIHFRKEGFCGTRDVEVTATPPADVHIEAGKLDACAHITLRLSSQQATVKALRAGDPNAKWVDLIPDKAISLAGGTYQLAVESGNRSYGTEVWLESGRTLDFSPQFPAMQSCVLDKSAEVTYDGNRVKPKNASEFVYLSSGCLNVNLNLMKPKAGFTGKRRVDWVLETPEKKGRIVWQLDGEKISRKSIVEKSFDQHSAIIEPLMNGPADAYVIRIRVEGSRVVITNRDGAVLDEYAPQNPAFSALSGARLGIKSSAGFSFSSGGQ